MAGGRARLPCRNSSRVGWDALTGEPLHAKEVHKARALEIAYLKQMTVDTKVPLDEAKSAGQRVLGV